MHEDLLALATAREGHFPLESGHHGRLWLDLEGMFADPLRLGPFVDVLATALRPHAPEVVCGPLIGGAFLAQMLSLRLPAEFLFTERGPWATGQGLYGVKYQVPRSLRERIRGRRIAIVDDAISAGSAVRGTYDALRALGAQPVAVGALLLLGSAALPFFAVTRVSVTSVVQLPYDLWTTAECPLCASGVPLEDPVGDGIVQEVEP